MNKYALVKDKWNQLTGDFLTQNIKQIQKWEETVWERRMRTKESMERIVLAKQKKKALEIENMKMKYFLVHRWEIIKEKKKQYGDFIQKLKKQRDFKRTWAKIIITNEIINSIFGIFNKQRNQVQTQ